MSKWCGRRTRVLGSCCSGERFGDRRAVTEEMLSRILQESVTGAFLEVIHMVGFTRIYRVNNEWEFLEL